jgi:hypothetical protein
MNDIGVTPHEDESPWWPAKWMFFAAAIVVTVATDPNRDRENWGMTSVLAITVPVIVLLGRDLVSIARPAGRRSSRFLAIAVEMACVVGAGRYLWLS